MLKQSSISTHDGHLGEVKRAVTLSFLRKRERYAVIYVWEILEGLAPKFGIYKYINPCTGQYCILPKIMSSPLKMRTNIAKFWLSRPAIYQQPLWKPRRPTWYWYVSFEKIRLNNFLLEIPDEPTLWQKL